MKIVINVNTDGACWQDNPIECTREIAEAMYNAVLYGDRDAVALDANGNRLAEITITKRRR